ncbi:MAG: uroporphyrinogen-III C-methyltransferase [Desulfobacteraceae bacterium]|nr:uroporphyrinogen-III C-methyltransferase [Desulfobacteraceae bacterium]
MKQNPEVGKVYLVGAGPGDPGLITVKGTYCIQHADALIYDYLAAPELIRYARPGAELIYVGKKGGDHTMSQEEINALIVEKARQGLTVTRLKGGDPFIFGRGGEEAEELMNDNIPFEIVPGVTSAVAAPAYAGIPLTHRKFASSVAFITGHEDPTKPESSINYHALADGIGTLVFFMGIKNLPNIIRNLISGGKPAETPVAVVRWGTTPRQETVTGTLDTIVEIVKTAGIKAPALIIVGDVVTLRDRLKWFETRPLMGKCIVVTRARAQAGSFTARLAGLGAECYECPTIRVVPPEDWSPLDEAIAHLRDYHWLVFTSVNGVDFFFKRLFEKGKDARHLGNLRTAVIGPATQDRLQDFGLRADIVPETFRAESIIDAFKNERVTGQKVLLPRALEARPILPVELSAMGAQVNEVATYQTTMTTEGSDELLEKLKNRQIDMITFTSSSTVRNFCRMIPETDRHTLLKDIAIASIGPITTETAQTLGLNVSTEATDYTIDGLCCAILDYYAN